MSDGMPTGTICPLSRAQPLVKFGLPGAWRLLYDEALNGSERL